MMSGSFRAVITATAAAGLGVTIFAPRSLFEITVCAIAVVVALGWGLLLPRGGRLVPITGILLVVAIVSVLLVRLTHGIAWLAPIVALALIAIFVAQMFRTDREHLVDQVAGHLTGALIVASGAGWLAVDQGPVGSALILTASVSLAAAAIITALPLRPVLSAALAVPIAMGVGVALGQNFSELTLLSGGLIGFIAGLVVASVHYLFGEYSESETALPSLSGALIAVVVTGVPIYMLGRVLLHLP